MNRFGYRTPSRYSAATFWAKIEDKRAKGDYHFTVGNTELIKACGLLVNNTAQFPFDFKKYVVSANFLTSQVSLNLCNARKAH